MPRNKERNDRGRVCTVCGEFKLRNKYHKKAGGLKGRQSSCSECASVKNANERARGKIKTFRIEEAKPTGVLSSLKRDENQGDKYKIGQKFKHEGITYEVHSSFTMGVLATIVGDIGYRYFLNK